MDLLVLILVFLFSSSLILGLLAPHLLFPSVDMKVRDIWNTYSVIPGWTDEVVLLGK